MFEKDEDKISGDTDEVNAETAGSPVDNSSDPLDDVINAAIDNAQKGDGVSDGVTGQADQKPADDVETVKSAENDDVAGDDQEPVKPATDEELEPPLENWSAEHQAQFAQLPDNASRKLVKDMFTGLQGGVTRNSQELDSDVQYANNMRSVFDESTKQAFAQQGLDEIGATRQLVGLYKWSRTAPVEYIQAAMRDLGVTMEQITGQNSSLVTDAGLDPDWADPDVMKLGQTLDGKLQSVSQLIDDKLNTFTASQAQQAWQTEVAAFAATTSEDGQAKYPHFEQLKPQIMAVMKANHTLPMDRSGLAQAYSTALYADPVLGPAAIKAQAEAELVAQRQETPDPAKAAAVEKAKKAAAPVKDTNNTEAVAVSPTGPNALDDAIAQAMNSVGGYQ